MTAWTAKSAMEWVRHSPSDRGVRAGHIYVWRWNGKIVATDGHIIVLRPGAGVAPEIDTPTRRRGVAGLSRAKLLRPFRITDRFRDWLLARTKETPNEHGAVVVSIGGHSFNAFLLWHVVKLAPKGARLALQRGGRLEPAHIKVRGFHGVVMPMWNKPPTSKRHRWPS